MKKANRQPKPQSAIGRPPIPFSQNVADKLCLETATSNKSLRTLCAPKDMPGVDTIYRWMRENPIFREQYARAKADQADWIFEEILEISDTVVEGVRVKTYGEGEGAKTETQTADMVERARLQVDARKWIVARLAPKKYGDFSRNEVSGPDGGPVQIQYKIPETRPITR